MPAFSVPRFKSVKESQVSRFIANTVDVLATSAAITAELTVAAFLSPTGDSSRVQEVLDVTGPDRVRAFVARRDLRRPEPARLRNQNVFVGGTPVDGRIDIMDVVAPQRNGREQSVTQETILPPLIAIAEPTMTRAQNRIRAARGCVCSLPSFLLSKKCQQKCR